MSDTPPIIQQAAPLRGRGTVMWVTLAFLFLAATVVLF
jgi:hypothetical protein